MCIRDRHSEMWDHPAVQQNLDTLRSRGVVIIPPDDGRLAGGDVGSGRLADPAVIVDAVLSLLDSRTTLDLAGVRVVVSAGGTREPIDPVRVLTNRSSGKQGHAIAEAAARRGAEVELVTTTDRPVTHRAVGGGHQLHLGSSAGGGLGDGVALLAR